MRILISNDDGFFAEGINTLAQVLSDIADVFVAAPDRNRSGASNSLTLENPLRIREEKPQWISVQGTPTDCVHLALNEWLETPPDMVITGINHGANLGDDVVYSGTVAAAMEAHFLGIPAIAVSLVGHTHFDTAAQVVKNLVLKLQQVPLSPQHILNVNVPDVPLDAIQALTVTRLGSRHHTEAMVKTKDPRGQDIYWFGPLGQCRDDAEDTDFHAIANLNVSITPIMVDLTAYNQLSLLKQWVSGQETE